MNLPDDLQSMACAAEDRFIDENTCMNCQKKVDYELICIDPMGFGAVCAECAGPGIMKKVEEVER